MNLLTITVLLSGLLLGVEAFTYTNRYVKSANELYKNKVYDKSIQLFLKAEKEVKDKNSISFNIANAYYKNREFEKALEYFERSLAGSDDKFNARVMFNMGNCFFKKGELSNAYDKYKSSLKLDHSNIDAKYNLEFVLSMMDKNKKRVKKREGKKTKRAKRRSASLSGDGRGSNNRPRRDSEAGTDDNNDVNSDDDFSEIDGLEDIAPDDALRILSTLTEQVIMRVPVKEHSLTKKGEHNEKDW